MLDELEMARHYQKYFFTVKADSPELRKIAYQLRYKVYIEECMFDIHTYDDKDKIERDEYDDDSLHALLFHKPTNQAIGYIRLIPYNQERFELLPLEKYGKIQINDDINLSESLRSNRIGEISRMCLLSSFRQRRFDQIYLTGSETDTENFNERRFPINYLALCLSFMSINLVFEANLDHAVAMMEKPLAMLIKKYGIQHRQLGKFIEYCGYRAPFLILPQQTYNYLTPEMLELYKVIRAELASVHVIS
jgi:N-acyl amino acid synthase of PEP-CTERM/exosortase system